jgi:hypothetical protein
MYTKNLELHRRSGGRPMGEPRRRVLASSTSSLLVETRLHRQPTSRSESESLVRCPEEMLVDTGSELAQLEQALVEIMVDEEGQRWLVVWEETE